MSEPSKTRHAVSRRSVLKTIGASAGAATLLPWLSNEGLLAYGALQRAQAPPALKVLTASQYATVEALSEAIIPADDRSPGAKAARVADYVDLLLSESEPELRTKWQDGLTAIDAEAATRFQTPLPKLDAAQLETLLTDISRNEKKPVSPAEIFFTLAKQATIHGYYSSEIGIHQELGYKGNQYLPEFVGCLTEDGKDCPHCGQKAGK